MAEQITVKLHVYGIFHSYYHNQEEIILNLPKQSNLIALGQALWDDIKNKNPQFDEEKMASIKELIQISVFAKSDTILKDLESYQLSSSENLSILPPVCGG